MTWVHAVLWGLFGSFAVEGLDLWAAIRRQHCWPWQAQAHGPQQIGALGYCVAELVRLLIGGGLAAAATLSGQILTPVAALAVGVAAPFIVERLSRQIPLTDVSQDTFGSEETFTISHAAQQRLPDSLSQRKRLLTTGVSELASPRTHAEKRRAGDDVKQIISDGDELNQVKE